MAVKPPNPKYIPKPYEQMQYPGQRVQIDVKFVPAACLVGEAKGHKFYQYTAIDEYSRFRYLEAFEEHSTYSSALFIEHLIKAFPFPIKCVQTDNGAEFTKRLLPAERRPPHTETRLKQCGIEHKLIRPYTPRHNGKVERSHRKDNEYFDTKVSFCTFFLEMYKTYLRLASREIWLALSGGFALNCPCNSFLMNKFRFKGFIAPPCVNDSGQSLGMALYYFYQKDSMVKFNLENAFYGNEYRIDDILRDFGDYIVSCTPANEEEFVKDILNDSIIWFEGKSEIGPRALGHRSLLSSPLSIDSKNRLNEIKLRQKWRPVAPIVLEEVASNYFEDVNMSPFMLRTFKVADNKLDAISAVAHLDRSSRIQTIAKNSDNIAKAIEWFGERTGVYMLCNTSLNDRGEPIIDAPFEAINFAYKKGLSVLYLCNYRIELDRTKSFNIDRYYKHKWKTEEANDKYYPLSKEEFVFCYWSEGLAKLDLTDVKNIKLIKRMYNAYSERDDWKEKRSLSNFYY